MTITRSDQITVGAAAAGTVVDIYTVPAKTVVLLKSFSISTYNGVGGEVVVYVRPAGNLPGALALVNEPTVPATNVISWSGWHVLLEGDVLAIYSSQWPCIYLASGAVLPAD